MTAAGEVARATRDRCIDEVLRLAADCLDVAAIVASNGHIDYARELIREARVHYFAAWILASSRVDSGKWPNPSEWEGWAREACGIAEARS